jgi:CheY-like chemotaxis protein
MSVGERARRPRRLLPVLVVDDDLAVRQAVEWLLEGDGFTVVTAADGAEALDRLRKGLEPCLILLDLMMPRMNGFEFRKAQMQDPKLAAIPLAVCSAHGAAGCEDELRGAAYLAKPFAAGALLELVEQHCARD